MNEDYVRALRTELAGCEETGNPRADQVREALADAGAAEDAPKRRGSGRARKENTAESTPKEKA